MIDDCGICVYALVKRQFDCKNDVCLEKVRIKLLSRCITLYIYNWRASINSVGCAISSAHSTFALSVSRHFFSSVLCSSCHILYLWRFVSFSLSFFFFFLFCSLHFIMVYLWWAQNDTLKTACSSFDVHRHVCEAFSSMMSMIGSIHIHTVAVAVCMSVTVAIFSTDWD